MNPLTKLYLSLQREEKRGKLGPMGYVLPATAAAPIGNTLFRKAVDAVNFVLVPLRLVVPQPLVARIPLLRTNAEERFSRVLACYTGRALDIGCGDNWLIRAYRAAGGIGTGVDVYDWGGADAVVKDAACLDFSDATFDSVSIVAALNHMPNRVAVLNEAHRLLKPGSRLIVTNLTPGISLVWHRMAFWDADHTQRRMAEGEVWGFTDSALRDMVDAAGFRLTRRESFMWRLNHLYLFERDRD